MREPTTRRDQREIVVPRDARPGRTSTRAAPPRAARKPPAGSALGEFLVTIAALGRWAVRICTTRPGEALGSVAALAAVAYVTVNALGFQSGQHPAPILPQPAAPHARAEPDPAVRAPAPPAQTAQAAAAPAPKEKAEPKHAEKPPARDAIGDILRSAGDTTASVSPKPVDKVAQAQRALSKLGYGAISIPLRSE